MNGNYIKICRSLLDWEWYLNENTMRVFIHCLLKANWKDGRFEGVEVPRGSFVTSIPALSEELELSYQNTRTALNHLKSTGEITVTSYPKFSVITVNKYCEYQDANSQSNSQLTGNQQATNRQLTTIEESKKERKKENNNSVVRFQPPSLDDVQAYCDEKGYHIDAERFIDYYTSNGWMVGKNKMKDWKAAVRNWTRQGRTAEPKKKAEVTDGFKLWD